MISSNSRARKWFDEQTRHRTSEQMIATLDLVFKTKKKEILFSSFFCILA